MNDHTAVNDDIALILSADIADRLAHPDTAPAVATADRTRQHLALGPIGIALLHIERSAAGLGPWQRAHDWLAAADRLPFTSGADSHPFYGAPALAHVLACAAEHTPAAYAGAYRRNLGLLDRQVVGDVRRRLDAAHRRIDAAKLPALAEFDAIRGLTGLGGYLLRRDPASSDTQAVLDYCIRLAEPITHDGEALPGWWAPTGPSGRPDDRFPEATPTTAWPTGSDRFWRCSRCPPAEVPPQPATTGPCAPSWPGSTGGRRAPRTDRRGRTGSTATTSAPAGSRPPRPGAPHGATAPRAWRARPQG